jgi:hypothetical protein
MKRPSITIFVLCAMLGSTILSTAAMAERRHGHIAKVRGPYGGSAISRRHVRRDGGDVSVRRSVQTAGGYGYRRQRQVDREPGRSQMNRSFTTNSGRGWDDTRQRSWGDGAYSASASRQYHNGKSSSRNVTATNNGDGTATYNATRTRIDGSTRTRSGTVPYPGN